MWTVYRKEMRSYFVSPIPYVLIVIFVAFMGWWFFSQREFFLIARASLDPLFVVVPWVLVFLVPAITMRLWSEEARGGTLETLLTVPIRPWQLVGGKFLSAWTLLLVCLLATIGVPVSVALLGDLDWGPVIGGYLGALFVGAALLALGLWISALTAHQIVAYLITMVLGFVLVILRGVASDIGGGLGTFVERLSVASRYDALGRGVVDLRDLVYFVSFAAFFLYLNAQAVENRRYR